MNEDDYYLCNDCGELIIDEEIPRDKKNECPICGSENLDFFKG